jgi:threonine dehydrogenase-like Zn-dependent dehydrogenase
MAKEIDFRGSFRFDKEFEQAVDLIVQGKLDVQQLITARRPLAERRRQCAWRSIEAKASRSYWRRS